MEESTYSCIEKPKKNKGGLYIASKSCFKNPKLLNHLKITHILSLTKLPLETKKKIKKEKINHLSIICKDSSKFEISIFLEKFAFFIKNGLKFGNVLVHCNKGISRSSTAIIAFFIKFRNMTSEGATNHIGRYRDCIYPNYGFQQQLKEFEMKVLMNS